MLNNIDPLIEKIIKLPISEINDRVQEIIDSADDVPEDDIYLKIFERGNSSVVSSWMDEEGPYSKKLFNVFLSNLDKLKHSINAYLPAISSLIP